jgi:tetratricopeptide (TPR) repeat protein
MRAVRSKAFAAFAAFCSMIISTAAVAQNQLDRGLGRRMAEARLRAIADGDVAGAVPLYQAIVDQATGSVRANAAVELGEALDSLGRAEEAETAFRVALAADPLNSRAAGHLARVGAFAPGASGFQAEGAASGSTDWTSAGGWEALLPPAERAGFRAQIERFSRERAAKTLYQSGKRQWAGQDRERAAATLTQVVSQFATELSEPELRDIAEIAMQGGRPRLAASAFRAAIGAFERQGRPRQKGLEVWLRFRLGEALMQSDDMAEARVAFREIMALGPAAKAHNGRALAIPAEMHFRETRGLRDSKGLQSATALFRQAQDSQYARHQPDDALAHYRRIAAEFPESNFDGRALAQAAGLLWFEKQDEGAALETIDQILQGDRKNDLWPDGMRAGAWALFTQGRIREAAGDRQGAKAAYKQLVDEWPEARDHDGKPFGPRAQQRLTALGGTP